MRVVDWCLTSLRTEARDGLGIARVRRAYGSVQNLPWIARLSLRRLRLRESRVVSTVLITAGSRCAGVSYSEYEGSASGDGDGRCSPVIRKSQLLKKQGSTG